MRDWFFCLGFAIPVVVFLSPPVAVLGEKEAWTEIRLGDNAVVVSMPGAAHESLRTTNTPVGTMTTRIYAIEKDSLSMSADFTVLPRIAVEFSGTEHLYNNAAGHLLHETLGKKTSAKDITVAGYLAKEFCYETPAHADGPALKQYQYVNFPGWIRSNAPLYDDIYVATGPNAIARVELTDSANYDKSRIVAVQPSTSWSSL